MIDRFDKQDLSPDEQKALSEILEKLEQLPTILSRIESLELRVNRITLKGMPGSDTKISRDESKFRDGIFGNHTRKMINAILDSKKGR